MSDENDQLVTAHQDVQPSDIIAGLGLADRALLAACLALFEDSTLSKHLEQLYSKSSDWVRNGLRWLDVGTLQKWLGDANVQEETASLRTQMTFWLEKCLLTDNDLRLILWIYLREAFDLPARLTVSTRGADVLATELAAAAIHAADPPSLIQDGKNLLQRWRLIKGNPRCISLADVVLPVLDDLITTALKDGAGQMDATAQERLIAEMRARLEGMSEADQQRLLDKIGAKDFNHTAIRNMLLTGGGLAAINIGVGAAGFSAYILAAQASAFIPMVSGPALVSFVSVISNPVTMIGGTAGAIWWATSSAEQKIQTAVGLRVLALLALRGISDSNRNGIVVTLDSFSRAKALRPIGNLDDKTAKRYRDEWHVLESVVGKPGPRLDAGVIELMNRPAMAEAPQNNRLARLLFPGDAEVRTTAVVAALTLGDIVYSAAAIDATVIKAADFASLDVLDNPLAFAYFFARRIQELSPAGIAGATSNVKGYVAEQVVAAELVAKGHQVEFPATSNEPGWDLRVDGEKFQVKCLEDIGGLKAHFDNYDYPVLANSELVDKIPPEWADHNVFFVEGYSDELIGHVTGSSMAAGADVFNPAVPVFALGVSAIRNLMNYNAGKVSGTQAVEQIVLDGSTRAGLAVAGGYLGTGIGLLVFGPAGALVWGSVLPVLAQAQASRFMGLLDGYIQTEAYTKWTSSAHSPIDALVTCLEKAIRDKIQLLRDKDKALGAGQLSDYVRYRFTDEMRFLDESQARLAQLRPETRGTVEQRALDVIRWTAGSTIHPVRYQVELARLNETLKRRPSFLAEVIGSPGDVLDKATGAIGGFIGAVANSCVAGAKASWKDRKSGSGER